MLPSTVLIFRYSEVLGGALSIMIPESLTGGVTGRRGCSSPVGGTGETIPELGIQWPAGGAPYRTSEDEGRVAARGPKTSYGKLNVLVVPLQLSLSEA
jgi:hypothetical protein